MKEKQQITLTLLHIVIGSLIAFHLPLSKTYALLIVSVGFYIVVKNKNKNNEILYVIAYIAGSEVFLRTTYGNPFHEFGKYFMLFFTLLGFYFNGFPKIKNPYWIYLLLLIPSIFLSYIYINDDFRKKVFFEILGPICMGVLALYTYKRKISSKEIMNILNFLALPILVSCVYLILKFSQNVDVVNSYTSNYYFSGNYGPNQMSTALGLGAFVYLLKLIFESDNKKIFYLNMVVFCIIFYRGLLTFSRGGIATGLIVIMILILSIYISRKGEHKIKRKTSFLMLIIASIFILTACQTENSLFKRYTNFEIFNPNDRIKKTKRYLQIKTDIENFIQNPIIGVGVGKGEEIRILKYNTSVSTHSEMTRLLSEHGIIGLFALLILLFFPLQHYFNDLRNFYFLPFFIFWMLTINHSATRIIAPLFLYALALMQVKFEKEESAMIINK